MISAYDSKENLTSIPCEYFTIIVKELLILPEAAHAGNGGSSDSPTLPLSERNDE